MSSSSSDTDNEGIQEQIASKNIKGQSARGGNKNAQNRTYSNKNESKSKSDLRKDKHKQSMETEYYDYFYSSDYEYEYEYEYDFEPSEKFTKAQGKSQAKPRKAEVQAPKPKKQEVSEHDEEEEEIVPEIEEIIGTYAAYYKTKTERAKYSDKPYYVKYKDEAYKNAMWMSQKEIASIINGDAAIEKFNALSKKTLPVQSFSHPFLQIPRTFIDSSWYQPERVINDAITPEKSEYLIKWRGRTYNDASWEVPKTLKDDNLIEKYKARLKLHISRKISSRITRPPASDYQADNTPIVSHLGIEITPNQRDAMNWILKQFYNGQNSIISSDSPMISIVACVCALQRISKALKQPGGYLIISKEEDCYLWKDAMDNWTTFDATIFYGDKASRDLIDEIECTAFDDKGNELPNDVQFDVMIVPYVELKRFMTFIDKFEWRYIIADTAGDTKKTASALTKSLVPGKTFGMTVIQDGREDVAHYKPIIDVITKDKENVNDSEICSHFEADFPVTEITNVPIELSPEQLEIIRELMNDARKDLVAANSPTGSIQNEAAPGIMRLLILFRQAIAHPFFIRDKRRKLTEGTDKSDIGKFSAKFSIAERMAKSGEYGRMLIFAQLPGVMELLGEHFKNIGIKFNITSPLDAPMDFNEKVRAATSKDNGILLFTSKGGSKQIPLEGFDTVLVLDNDTYIFNCPGKRIIRLIARGTIEEFMTYEGYSQMVFDDLDQSYLGRCGRYPITLLPAEHILQWSAYTVLEAPDRSFEEYLSMNLDELLAERISERDISKHIDSSEFWMGALAQGTNKVSAGEKKRIGEAIERVIRYGIGVTKPTFSEDAQIVSVALNMTPNISSKDILKKLVKNNMNPFSDEAVAVVISGRANQVTSSAIMFEKIRRALYRLTLEPTFPKFTDWGTAQEIYTLMRRIYMEGLDGDLFEDFPGRSMSQGELLEFINNFLKYAKAKMPPNNFVPEETIELVESTERSKEVKSEDERSEEDVDDDKAAITVSDGDDSQKEKEKDKEKDEDSQKEEDDDADDEGGASVTAFSDCPEGIVVKSVLNHGIPDTTKLSFFVGRNINADIVEDVRKELLDAIENNSFDHIDILKPVQKLLNDDVLKEIKNVKIVFDKIYDFTSEPFEIETNVKGVPEWWSAESSKYYIEGLARVGLSAPFRIIAKRGGAFFEQIKKENLEEFKSANKLEKKHLPVETELDGFEFMNTYAKRLELASRILKINLC